MHAALNISAASHGSSANGFTTFTEVRGHVLHRIAAVISRAVCLGSLVFILNSLWLQLLACPYRCQNMGGFPKDSAKDPAWP